ncbi:MAG: dihydroorotate dehydrogenase catalytic subunit [Bdellovibrionales bacterium]|nr:dihydroorotate dehydrogenase catalytic subunit [Bdellovibrionales bacterium]
MSITFLGREYASPLWVASGTFGWGLEAVDGAFWPRGLSAVVTKGVSPDAMNGAPHPRVVESGHGVALLNAIGLQNPGLEGFLARYVVRYRKNEVPCPLWVNVLGSSIEGYARVVEKIALAGGPWLAGFELNVSCPNVDKGGTEFGADGSTLRALVEACVRVAGGQPIMVKLSPAASDIVGLAQAAVDGGAAALSLVNTFPAGLPEVDKRDASGATVWSLGRRYGGLSGPALKPMALRLVDLVRSKSKVPLCGVGGIECARDVREFLAAGADVVQVGTANFANPWVVEDIARELEFI